MAAESIRLGGSTDGSPSQISIVEPPSPIKIAPLRSSFMEKPDKQIAYMRHPTLWEEHIAALDAQEQELHTSQLRLLRTHAADFGRMLSAIRGDVSSIRTKTEVLSKDCASLREHTLLNRDRLSAMAGVQEDLGTRVASLEQGSESRWAGLTDAVQDLRQGLGQGEREERSVCESMRVELLQRLRDSDEARRHGQLHLEDQVKAELEQRLQASEDVAQSALKASTAGLREAVGALQQRSASDAMKLAATEAAVQQLRERQDRAVGELQSLPRHESLPSSLADLERRYQELLDEQGRSAVDFMELRAMEDTTARKVAALAGAMKRFPDGLEGFASLVQEVEDLRAERSADAAAVAASADRSSRSASDVRGVADRLEAVEHVLRSADSSHHRSTEDVVSLQSLHSKLSADVTCLRAAVSKDVKSQALVLDELRARLSELESAGSVPEEMTSSLRKQSRQLDALKLQLEAPKLVSLPHRVDGLEKKMEAHFEQEPVAGRVIGLEDRMDTAEQLLGMSVNKTAKEFVALKTAQLEQTDAVSNRVDTYSNDLKVVKEWCHNFSTEFGQHVLQALLRCKSQHASTDRKIEILKRLMCDTRAVQASHLKGLDRDLALDIDDIPSQVRILFDVMDVDKDGKISRTDIRRGLINELCHIAP